MMLAPHLVWIQLGVNGDKLSRKTVQTGIYLQGKTIKCKLLFNALLVKVTQMGKT